MKRIQAVHELSKEHLNLMSSKEHIKEQIKERIEFELVNEIAREMDEAGLLPLIEEERFNGSTVFKKIGFFESAKNLKEIYEKINLLRRLVPDKYHYKIDEIQTLLKQ